MFKVTKDNFHKLSIEQMIRSLFDCKMKWGNKSPQFEILRDLYTGPATGLVYDEDNNDLKIVDSVAYNNFKNEGVLENVQCKRSNFVDKRPTDSNGIRSTTQYWDCN